MASLARASFSSCKLVSLSELVNRKICESKDEGIQWSLLSLLIVHSTLSPANRETFSSEVVAIVDAPHYFVDFLREPIVDVETGEVLVANPSFYEGLPGNLSDLRSVLPT